MYKSLPQLQSAVRTALEKDPQCRIYRESLQACWPNVPDDERAEKIAEFASRNRWTVLVRTVTGLGCVAEFQKLKKFTITQTPSLAATATSSYAAAKVLTPSSPVPSSS
jgi:hypothetical protein